MPSAEPAGPDRMTRRESHRSTRGRRVVYRHANGATACLDENPDTPLATVSIRIGGGASTDPDGKSGLAHLFEHLFFVGTPDIGPGGYVRAVQELGGQANAATSSCWIKFYDVFSSELLTDVLALETDRFAHTVAFLTDALVEREKAIVLRERAQRVDSAPNGDALEHLYRLLYGDHPLGRLPVGRTTDVTSVTRDDCVAYFERAYRGGSVHVAVSGGIDADRAREPVAALLSVFGAGAPVTLPPVPPPGRVATHEISGGHPSALHAGYLLPPAEDAGYDDVRLASYLLGRGTGAWLRRHVVGDGTVVAGLDIKTMTRIGAPSVGVIEIRPAPGTDIAHARDRLHTALAGLDPSSVTPDDLNRARAAYARSWYEDDDTTQARAEGLTLALLRSGRPGRYEEELSPVHPDRTDTVLDALRHWRTDRIAAEVIYR